MITERLMALGSFEIKLRPGTPRYILDEVDIATRAFSRVVVTKTRIDPSEIGLMSASTVNAQARYIGILRDNKDGYTLSGSHLAVLLGDENGIGPVVEVNYTGELSYFPVGWWSALFDSPTPNGFTAGSVSDSGASDVYINAYLQTVRRAMDLFCAQSGVEWRVNNDRTVDCKIASLLFVNTPTVMVMEGANGRDPNIIGLQSVQLAQGISSLDYNSRVVVSARGNGGVSFGDQSNTARFYAPDGNAIEMVRVVDAANAASSDASTLATNLATQFNTVRRSVTIRVKDGDIRGKITPGDNILVYSPTYKGLFDAAGYKTFRGRDTYPLTIRCVGMQYPVQDGYGVYLITSEATARVVDLTPWFVPETGDVTLEVGSSALRVQASPQLSAISAPTVMGSQSSALAGAYTDISSTQTLTNVTKGNGTLRSKYRYLDAKTVRFKGSFQMGSTSAVTGTIQVPLPVNALSTGYEVGKAKAEDGSFNRYVGVAEVQVANFGQEVHFASDGNSGWNATTPFTWGTGNVFVWDMIYEAA